MLYEVLADLILLLHLVFILFVVFGVFLVFKFRKLAWFHIPVMTYGMLISFFRWVCPLTPLENHFRTLAGEQGYQGGFIEHYLLPLIYPSGMTMGIAIAMGLFVLLWNTVFYIVIFYKYKKGR
ncbi:MAG: DUF2784 domain-containing protein [Thioalkalispiraceae bacterium]|jgi:hypothetical protein